MREPKGYTEKMLAVIDGTIKPENVNGRLAALLLKTARMLGDEEVTSYAAELVAQSKERARKSNIIRASERNRKVRTGEEIVWKQPKNGDYTEKQKQIVRSEIPLESVHTKALITICQKAKLNGDLELSERMYDLIMERRESATEKLHHHRGSTLPYTPRLIKDDNDAGIAVLTWKMIRFLTEDADPREYPLEDIRNVVNLCRLPENARYTEVALLKLQYREHPESVYVTQDHAEAIDIIEELVGRPIRRPKTWFTE